MNLTDTDLQAFLDSGAIDRESLSAVISELRLSRRNDGTSGVVAEIEGLIDAYWGLAFTEGSEGRTTDTPDGRAQETRSAISRRLSALAAPIQPVTNGWKDEFRQAIEELEAPLEALGKIGIDWSLCPTSPEEIAAARIDWKARAITAETSLAALNTGEPKL